MQRFCSTVLSYFVQLKSSNLFTSVRGLGSCVSSPTSLPKGTKGVIHHVLPNLTRPFYFVLESQACTRFPTRLPSVPCPCASTPHARVWIGTWLGYVHPGFLEGDQWCIHPSDREGQGKRHRTAHAIAGTRGGPSAKIGLEGTSWRCERSRCEPAVLLDEADL